jgi:hypothetical protein
MSDDYRTQHSSSNTAADTASKHVLALALLHPNFANTIAQYMYVVILGTPAVMKLLADQFFVICLLKNARKGECGHDRDLPAARNIILDRLPIAYWFFGKG